MDLSQYLDNTWPGPGRIPAAEQETWTCKDDAAASWLVGKIDRANRRVQAILEQARAEISKIEEWASLEVTYPQRDIAWATAHIEAYAKTQRDMGRKSIRTPHGTISTRATGGGLIVDEPSLMDWLRSTHPDWIVHTEAPPTKTDLKGRLAITEGTVLDPATSEIVPGLEVTPPGVGVTIKFGG